MPCGEDNIIIMHCGGESKIYNTYPFDLRCKSVALCVVVHQTYCIDMS